MERGDVYWLDLDLPDRTKLPFVPFRRVRLKKYIVILRGGPDAARETDVPFVIASTDDYPDEAPRDFEVPIAGGGPIFKTQTIIDCRKPYTLLVAEVENAGEHRGHLSDAVMEEIDEALVNGLQMD